MSAVAEGEDVEAEASAAPRPRQEPRPPPVHGRHRGGCYYEMWRNHGNAVTTLASTERIFLWGLDL